MAREKNVTIKEKKDFKKTKSMEAYNFSSLWKVVYATSQKEADKKLEEITKQRAKD